MNANKSLNIDTKRKMTSPGESTPRKKYKSMESSSSNDIISGGCSLFGIEDIGCCIKCKLDNGHGLMLQCKGCRQWWHYHCVGFEETDNLVPRYECMKCRFKSKKLANSRHRESSYEADVPKTNYSEVQQSQSNSMCSDSSQQSKTKHNCQFCESLCFENKQKLQWHYYIKHFKADILAHVDRSKCKLCGYENVRRDHLLRHVITCKDLIGQLLEGGEIQKNFKCPLCIKTFGKKHHLSEHLSLVHYKEKKFQCPLCIKTFGIKSHLSSHLSLVHYKSKLIEYVNSGRLECLLCGKTFTYLSHVIHHVGAIHGKIKEFLDENFNHPSHQLKESSNSKPVENSQNGCDEAIEKTLQDQENLNLSASSIEDLLNLVNDIDD